MCGDEIGDFFEDASEFGGNLLMENMPATIVTGVLSPVGPWWLAFLHDFSTVDDDDVQQPPTRLDHLKDVAHRTNPSSVVPEDFSQESFESVYEKFLSATVPSGVAQSWGDIRNRITEATQNFQRDLAVLEGRSGNDGWKGATHDAAITNVRASLTEPGAAGRGAGAMEILLDSWSKTIGAIVTHIHGNWANYQRDLDAHPEFQDEIKREYNSFARKVMSDIYVPNIVEIAKNNPAFTDGGPPAVGPGQGGGPGGGPGTLGAGSAGGPKIPDFGGAKVPDFTSPNLTRPTTTSPDPGLTDPLRAATDAARNALGQAADAAKQAAAGSQDAGKGVPEGVLGLGPNGLGGAGKAGAGAGRVGGGAGASPRGLASGRAAGASPTAAAKLANATRAATAGAGLGAMGTPGAGAPAAGQRGAENPGYNASKALRRKKNGQKVAAEADAVVPVVGAPEKRSAPAANQPEQFDQSDQPDRGGGAVRAAPWTARGAERVRSTA